MESKQEKPDLKHTELKKRPRNEDNPVDRLPPHSV